MEATLRDILANVETYIARKERHLWLYRGCVSKAYIQELELSITESQLIAIKLKRALVEFDIHMINTIQHAN